MIEKEVQANEHTSNSSCTKGLLWLKRCVPNTSSHAHLFADAPQAPASDTCALIPPQRAMQFVVGLMDKMQQDPMCSVAQAASDAYTEVLSPFHGWITSGIFKVALNVVPSREALFTKLALDTGADTLEADMGRFVSDFGGVLSKIHDYMVRASRCVPPAVTLMLACETELTCGSTLLSHSSRNRGRTRCPRALIFRTRSKEGARRNRSFLAIITGGKTNSFRRTRKRAFRALSLGAPRSRQLHGGNHGDLLPELLGDGNPDGHDVGGVAPKMHHDDGSVDLLELDDAPAGAREVRPDLIEHALHILCCQLEALSLVLNLLNLQNLLRGGGKRRRGGAKAVSGDRRHARVSDGAAFGSSERKHRRLPVSFP